MNTILLGINTAKKFDLLQGYIQMIFLISIQDTERPS
jgi:hypothetical protein